jgi:hypothetical protein
MLDSNAWSFARLLPTWGELRIRTEGDIHYYAGALAVREGLITIG